MKKTIQLPIILLVSMFCMVNSACDKYLDIVPEGKTLLTTFDDYNKVINYASYHLYSDAEIRYLYDQVWINELAVIGRDPGLATISFLFDESKSRILFIPASGVYTNAYGYIARFSLIIGNIGSATDGTEAQKKQLLAEARALRAYAHFIVLNIHARPYNPATAATDNAIPIKMSFNLEETLKPSTTAQVYDFIESELKASVDDLAITAENGFHPNRAFGYGLLAKMYLFKGEFAKAKAAAEKSLSFNNFVYDMVQYYNAGQTDLVDIAMQENNYYATGGTTFSNPQNYVISKEMYDAYSSSDTRRLAFFSTTAPAVQVGSGTAAFIKQISGAGRFCYNTVGIKTTDVYLMLAECLARENRVAEALKIVDDIRRKRILPAGFTPSVAADGKAAVKLVIEERRKELLFGFHRFWDLRRLAIEPDYAITVTRKFPVVNTTVPQVTYTLSPQSHLYTIPFGNNITQINPFILQNTNDQP